MESQITVLGYCRNVIPSANQLSTYTTYPHCTKEIIQLIQYLRGEMDMSDEVLNKVLFHHAFAGNKSILFQESFPVVFANSLLYIVEISSRIKYIYKEKYYLHHLAVDKRYSIAYQQTPAEVWANHRIEIQSDAEIEKDLLLLREMLSPKPMLVVTHLFRPEWLTLQPKLVKRQNLIQTVETICKNNGIVWVNPMNHLQEHTTDNIIQPDFGHYTKAGMAVWFPILEQIVKDILG